VKGIEIYLPVLLGAMARMGHSTTNMLKNVYQYLMSEEEEKTHQQINGFFDNL
jgi:hypothetical protein